MTVPWFRRPQLLIAAGVFILTLAVYIATLARTTPFWDCGEFITTSHIVGVPHQPGTPMYVLVGRVFDILFGGADTTVASLNTAFAVNFMSAFFSALAVMLVYLIVWELSRRADPDAGAMAHVGGVVGAFFLAFSETFWNNAVEAEVYGLSAFMLALLTWLAIRWYDHREAPASNQLLLLMIYLLGLGVGFHLGSILVYPGVFLVVLLAKKKQLHWVDLLLMSGGLAIFLYSTMKPNDKLLLFLIGVYCLAALVRAAQRKPFVLFGSLLFVVGLSVHLIMMIRAGAAPEPLVNQTDPDTWDTMLSVIRREQYPPIDPRERNATWAFQFGYYYDYLLKQFYFLGNGTNLLSTISTILGPFLLAFIGLYQGIKRVWPLVLIPLAGYLINGELLTVYLNFTDHEVRDRDYFYFAAFLFMSIFIGLGASGLLRAVVGKAGETAEQLLAKGEDWRRAAQPYKMRGLVLVLAVVLVVISLLPMTPGHTKFYEHDRSQNRIAYEYAWNILAGLDENAILFTNGDNDTFPIWYLQIVEKFRTDVTVVNLSLVNLPWYIKQLKNGPEQLPMRFSDDEIDGLRHTIRRDPNTGQEFYIMIKDYVLADIMVTNQRTGGNRPVFFAVTIPRENMERYFSRLQMEGMAYRLTNEESPDKLPTTDPRRVLENMLGVYQLDALLDGDTPARQAEFGAMAGFESDSGELPLGRIESPVESVDFETLLDMMGETRTDVFRNKNARHLLGNYPAALNRAGFEYLLMAQRSAGTDTVRYAQALAKSLLAFEASLKLHPYNSQAAEWFPQLLMQAYRDEDAKAFLTGLRGNVPPELEEDLVINAIQGIVRIGAVDVALDWLGTRSALEPDRKFFYEVEFSLYEALGNRIEAERVMEAWQARSGETDPNMQRTVQRMAQEALNREQERIDDALGGSDGR